MASLLLLSLLANVVRGYIPAVPVNDSAALVSRSQDFVQLTWQSMASGPTGLIKDLVSRQLFSDTKNASIIGVNYGSRGALVHFSEQNATQHPAASVPFVCLVQCDTNGTVFSDQDDIFTLCRDRGAVAALLYSLTSQVCEINPWYLEAFEKPLDVYATTSLQSSRLIESQFQSVGDFSYWYDSQLLNNSATEIFSALNQTQVVATPQSVLDAIASASSAADAAYESSAALSASSASAAALTASPDDGAEEDAFSTSLTSGVSRSINTPTSTSPSATLARRQNPLAPTGWNGDSTGAAGPMMPARPTAATYLIALLGNVQATYAQANTTTASGTPQQQQRTPNTGLAMIILYAITGCVTALFLIVILSGAIRAIRHPERYGPRAAMGGPNGRGGQSRAGGITRALLDSIPIIKFSRNDPPPTAAAPASPDKDVEMGNMPAVRELERRTSGESMQEAGSSQRERSTSAISEGPAPAVATEGVNPTEVDDAHTCPICLVAFEEGEDMRILPCDGRHRFHTDCIDPWLLNVSSLCPLCRWDVATRRAQRTSPDGAAVEESDHEEEEASPEEATATTEPRSRTRSFAGVRQLFHHERDTTTPAEGHPPRETSTGFTPTRFAKYLSSVRAATSGVGASVGGRRRSARMAATAAATEGRERTRSMPAEPAVLEEDSPETRS